MQIVRSLSLLSLIVGCSIGCEPDPLPPGPSIPVPGPEAKVVTNANNAFAFDLYHQLRDSGKENLFFSPYSISSALAMTYAGARGQTEAEMAKVLHFTLRQDELHPLLGSVSQYLDGGGKGRSYSLSVANRLWPRNDFTLLDSYRDLVQTNYGADFTPLDFSGDLEGSRKMINQWVETKTNDKIKDLIKPGVIASNTVLVLTNAIHFKGDWALQFKESQTRPMPFFSPTEKKDVPMMHQTAKFRIAELPDLKLLELPYLNDDLSMLVVLPHKRDGLVAVEAKLNLENLENWQRKLQETEVKISLPKFKMTAEFELKPVLKAMGMPSAFSSGADFSGINGSRGISISKVIHKAFVDVNEEGTEAAAATAVIMVESVRMIARFQADHPFVFLIRNNHTGGILFVGRVVSP